MEYSTSWPFTNWTLCKVCFFNYSKEQHKLCLYDTLDLLIQCITFLHCAFNESSGNFKYHDNSFPMTYSMKHDLFVYVKYFGAFRNDLLAFLSLYWLPLGDFSSGLQWYCINGEVTALTTQQSLKCFHNQYYTFLKTHCY